MEMCPFSSLPEDCISNIISLTSPADACRAAAVSLGFRSAAESDAVWERFLPPDYEEIVSRSSSPVLSPTKKQVYFTICDSGLLLDEGKLSFTLSRSKGKKSYMLCAREVGIAWQENPIYWRWISVPYSRFAEVVELLSVCWLEINGVFPSHILSPNTNYSAYLVYKLVSDYHYGLDCPSVASVKKQSTTNHIEETLISNVVCIAPEEEDEDGRNRRDGWLEIELGQFFIAQGEQCDIQISLSETERLHWKRGLIVEGIEVRPKDTL